MAVAVAIVTPIAGAQTPPTTTWMRTVNPGGLDLGEDVAVDAEGNVYVTGIADVRGQRDIVTAKITPSGEGAWVRTIDEGKDDRGEAVVAVAGGVVVAGSVSATGGDNAIIRKYSAEGDTVWTQRLDKGTSEVARALAVDASGNLFVGGASVSMQGSDGFVAKLSADGNELWAHPINLFFVDEVFDVDADPKGGVFAVGRVVREDNFDLLLRKFAADGSVVWTRFVSTPTMEEGRGVAADASGGAYVVGTTTSTSNNRTQQDVLVAHFAADGALAWSRAYDLEGGDDEGRDVVLDASGNLLVTGFGLTNGTKGAFLLKLAPDGTELWRTTWDREGIDGVGAIARGPGGKIVLVGATQTGSRSEFDYLILAYDERQPSAAFNARAQGGGTSYAFEDASIAGHAPISRREWQFGDGATSSDENPTHDFQWGGDYEVRLTVVDANGNRNVATKQLAVQGPARPADTPTPATPTPTPPGNGGGLSPTPDESTPTPGPQADGGDDAGKAWIPGVGAAAWLTAVVIVAAALRQGRRRA